MGNTEIAGRIPAPVLFITAGFSQYIGAALAVGLFTLAPPHTVAWARAMVAGIVLLAVVRPWRYEWTRRTLVESAAFGVVLLAMNVAFYFAINYLPLGAAVALEFVGPVIVAARGTLGVRGKISVALAALGVALISFIGLDWQGIGSREIAIGLVAVFTASAFWSGYMIMGGKIASERSGHASLAVGMMAGALIFLPVSAPWAGGLATWEGLWLVIGLGLLSSVVPYMLDQVAIRRLGTATFALLNALLPATATVVGLLGLRQIPTPGELAGLVAITIAVGLSTRSSLPAVAEQGAGAKRLDARGDNQRG